MTPNTNPNPDQPILNQMFEIAYNDQPSGNFWPEIIRPKMHQLDFSKNQRKKRKDARKAFAAGDRRAFNK